MSYDYTIVGAGLFGAVVAYELGLYGKDVLVIERNDHIGGTVYTFKRGDINVHKYGAHIFRTDDKDVWDYINNFINTPIAKYNGEVYNLPFNMNTFAKMWNISTPDEAKHMIEAQRVKCDNPTNLEEYVLDKVGHDIYEKLIKGYTEKQWGKPCSELPPSIMSRIPIRLTYNNNYYDKKYQGVPIGGYTQIIEKMLSQATVLLNTDALQLNIHDTQKIIYTGCIDEFFNYEFGELEYRRLIFEHRIISGSRTQGVAVVNYTDAETPYTRSIEHHYFEGLQVMDYEAITRTYEYPSDYGDKFYPVPTDKNIELYNKYKDYAQKEYPNIVFCGRLGEYKYYDMEDTIRNAKALVNDLLIKEDK